MRLVREGSTGRAMVLLALSALAFVMLSAGEATPSSACEAIDNGQACRETGEAAHTDDEAALIQRAPLWNRHATLLMECEQTSFTLTVDGYSHTYELEKTTDGKEVSQPCNFGPYTLGNVTFKCNDTQFDADWNSCREPVTEGSCAKTNVEYTFAGHANIYNLPKMADDATSTHPCAMGPYTTGEVVFKCAKGRLGVAKQTCAMPPTAVPCGRTNLTYTIDSYSSTYKLGELANGEKHRRQCEAGPYTVGEVIFTCENGELITSNTCMTQEQHEALALGPGYCNGMLFTFTMRDSAGNYSHTYKFDMMKNGSEATPQCAMGNYTAGEVVFKCEDGHVSFMSHSCSKPVPEGSCVKTDFKYMFDDYPNVYKLPEMLDGAMVNRPCAMGPYTLGTVVFKCDSGSLSVSKQTCAHLESKNAIPQGECEQTPFKTSLGGYSHTYVLGKMSNGNEVSQVCSFGPYTLGTVVFKCNGNRFDVDRHSCRRPEGLCGKTEFNFNFNGHTYVYNMSWMVDGATATRPCAMGPYTVGEVVFKCAKGRLSLANETCAKPTASMPCAKTEFTYTVDTFFTNTYKLGESAHGQEQRHPCPAGSPTVGEVFFTCENGTFIASDGCKVQGNDEGDGPPSQVAASQPLKSFDEKDGMPPYHRIPW